MKWAIYGTHTMNCESSGQGPLRGGLLLKDCDSSQ